MPKDFHSLRSDLVSDLTDFIRMCEVEGRNFKDELDEAVEDAECN